MAHEAPQHLLSLYSRRAERSVQLVERAIELLKRDGARVSLNSIRQATAAVDPQGRGVAHTTILGNPLARELYETNRSWTRGGSPNAKRRRMRDPKAAARGRRLVCETKADLIRRILVLEEQVRTLESQAAKLRDGMLTASGFFSAKR